MPSIIINQHHNPDNRETFKLVMDTYDNNRKTWQFTKPGHLPLEYDRDSFADMGQFISRAERIKDTRSLPIQSLGLFVPKRIKPDSKSQYSWMNTQFIENMFKDLDDTKNNLPDDLFEI